MNCPSRTDEPPLTDHPTWNQNPPFLSADLTTRQDLNGMANARELRNGAGGGIADDDDRGGNGVQRDGYAAPERLPADAGRRHGLAWGSGTFNVSYPQVKGVSGGEGHSLSTAAGVGGALRAFASAAVPPASPFFSSIFGWLAWTASVLVCAAIMSVSRMPETAAAALFGGFRGAVQKTDGNVSVITRTDAIKATPLRRRSTCETGGLVSEDKYNTPLHVGALLIILFVSFTACASPLIVSRIPGMRLPVRFFFAVRHFGTGVLLATAFVHLLPTAFTLLGNPCLSSFWIEDYPAMPGAIALAAVFLVTIIEMTLHPARHLIEDERAGKSGAATATGRGCMSAAAVLQPQPQPQPQTQQQTQQQLRGDDTVAVDLDQVQSFEGDATVSRPRRMSIRRTGGNSSSLGRQLSHLSQAEGDATLSADAEESRDRQAGDRPAGKTAVADEENRPPRDGGLLQLSPQQQHQKDILQCMMLEVGILFHSVFIGMTLSVSVGHEFVILVVAIAFHQAFEGLALGSRIATIKWDKGSWQPWLMSLAYGCTTPLGQAIGIATHSLYNPSSQFGLVLVGTMNAISSGLLVFASLVELLSEDFLSDESWRTLRGRRRVYACFLVLFGAIGMSLVGAWA